MKLYPKFIGAAIVFVIIGMPLISYLYLRGGLSFRIDAITALTQDDSEKKLSKQFEKAIEITPKRVNVFINADKIVQETQNQLYTKFKGNRYFQLCTFRTSKTEETKTLIAENYIDISLSDSQKSILNNIDMLLIDTSGEVRETYKYNKEEFKTFIQHLSVLLPVESSKKIKLER